MGLDIQVAEKEGTCVIVKSFQNLFSLAFTLLLKKGLKRVVLICRASLYKYLLKVAKLKNVITKGKMSITLWKLFAHTRGLDFCQNFHHLTILIYRYLDKREASDSGSIIKRV